MGTVQTSGHPDGLTYAGVTSASAKRRVIAASFVGTTIEWYDFFVYSTASALIFNTQFFPTDDPLTGTLLAFTTFGVGFLARPVGAMVAGHFGDRIGRKALLIAMLLLMGGATMGIGMLPNYDSIGITASIMLVVLRFLQGFSAGGEWGGASLMSVEHAPPGRRGLWGASVGIGAPAGLIAANTAFLIVRNVLTKEQFEAWGWRIPFLLSAVLVGLGLWIRLKVTESPVFQQMKKDSAPQRMPLTEVLTKHPTDVIRATLAYFAHSGIGYLFLTFLISYGTQTLGLDSTTTLSIVIIGAGVWFVTTPLGGWLSDKFDRRTGYVIGYGIFVVWMIPLFKLFDTGSYGLMVLGVVVISTGLGIASGPQSALFAEMFDAKVRYTGISVAFSLGAIIGGGFAPLIATALVARTGGSMSVAIYGTTMALISLIATISIPGRRFLEARMRDMQRVKETATESA